nr:MAG TPA: hypothetical protein [Crassvirales sp.]
MNKETTTHTTIVMTAVVGRREGEGALFPRLSIFLRVCVCS